MPFFAITIVLTYLIDYRITTDGEMFYELPRFTQNFLIKKYLLTVNNISELNKNHLDGYLMINLIF